MSWYPIEIRHTPTEDAELRAYDELYTDRSLPRRVPLFLWFLRQLRLHAPPPARLLDVSCGEGEFLSFARRAGYTTAGIDFSLAALQKFEHHGGTGIPTVTANAQRLPFADASFDVVTNIGSLEHYFVPAEGVYEMARVLRPGGTAMVLVPNAYGLFGNILHVLKHGEVFDDGQPLQRYATRGSWQRLLDTHGLRVRKVLSLERAAPRTAYDLAWMLRHPQAFLRVFLGALVPPNLGDQLVFVCDRDI